MKNTGEVKISFQSAIGVQMTRTHAHVLFEHIPMRSEKIPPLTPREWVIVILKVLGRIFATLTGIAVVIGGIILAIVWMMPLLGDPINRLIVIVGFGYSGAVLIKILFMIIWG